MIDVLFSVPSISSASRFFSSPFSFLLSFNPRPSISLITSSVFDPVSSNSCIEAFIINIVLGKRGDNLIKLISIFSRRSFVPSFRIDKISRMKPKIRGVVYQQLLHRRVFGFGSYTHNNLTHLLSNREKPVIKFCREIENEVLFQSQQEKASSHKCMPKFYYTGSNVKVIQAL